MNDSKQELFLRKASGVVRAWSPLDSWIYNVIAINVVVPTAIIFFGALSAVPNGSLMMAFIIAGVFCTCEAIVYAMLASTMPRSGGDYIFQSRIFSGGVGTIFANTAIVFAGAIFLGLAGWLAAVVVIGPFFMLFGSYFNIPFLLNAGVWFSEPTGMFLITLAIIIWCAFINIAGMRPYALIQRYFLWLGLLCLAITLILLSTKSQSSFIAAYDSFLYTSFNIPNAYHGVIQAAKDAGFVYNSGGSLWSATILMIPFAAFQLIYPAWCVHQAGEIKRGNSLRAQMFQIVGAEIFSIILVVIIATVSISSVGKEFFASAGYLFNSGDLTPNVPPIFGFLAGMTTQNPLLLFIIMATFSFWFWMWCPNITLGASRVLLAMSFDRVLPSYVGEVNSRTHTPVNAIVLVSVAGIIIGILYSYTNFWKLTLSLALYNIGCFGVTCLAGALMPYIRPNTWKTSPAKESTIGGVPTITICGFIFFAFAVWCIYKYLFDSLYGINDPLSLVFILLLYGVSAAIYFISKWYRKKEGLDLGKIYEEIPVE